MSVSLTKKQQDVLDLIKYYRSENGRSPTLEWLAGEIGISKTSIFEHIENLIRKGVLRRNGKKGMGLFEPIGEDKILLDRALSVVDIAMAGKQPSDQVGDLKERLYTDLKKLAIFY